MTQSQPDQRLLAVLLLLCLLNPVRSDSGLNTSMNYANLSQAFPPLAALYTTHLKKSPLIGGQNFTQCCLEAVSLSYVIQNGQPVQNPNKALDFLNVSPNNFSQGQFPCGATYIGDSNGAQPVTVPYSWCKQNCGGWEQSTNTALSQWVQPFVGFILPAAVFCLNVPRKSVFGIPDDFFKDHFADLPDNWEALLVELAFLFHSLLNIFCIKRRPKWIKKRAKGSDAEQKEHPYSKAIVKLIGLVVTVIVDSLFLVGRATIAASIGLINTMLWVAVVFSTAGPMIMSGLYEASLDRKIITNILSELKRERRQREKEEEEGANPETKIDQNLQRTLFYKRIHYLYAVLVGNLKLPPTTEDVPEKPRTVWKDVNNLVRAPERLTLVHEHTNPESSKNVELKSEEQLNPKPDDQMAPKSEYRTITDTRLKGMLGCQASFGAAVGAPVVFFVGSFLFGVISNLTAVGDNDTAHALAFGQWWMTIPHVAIVSGCLLAGNNPNTLEVIVSSLTGRNRGPWEETDIPENKGFRKFYQPYYSSVYLPVEMWARGHNKRDWVDRVLDRYELSPTSTDIEGGGNHAGRAKKGEFHLTLRDWAVLIAITTVLMVLPFVLAFLTSFYTPAVGLSCRSLTFLLYFVFQVCFGIVWVLDFFYRFHQTQHVPWLPFATISTKEEVNNTKKGNGKEKETEESEKNGTADGLKVVERKNAPTPFGILVAILLLGSLFTTVVGTFLQILGVYRNCLCDIPISHWLNGDFLLAISTNTRDEIYYAQKFWLPTGVASICLMIVVCYIGWWYQRHWRSQFKDAVEQLLGPEPPKEIKREAEQTQGANAKSGLFRKRNALKRATSDATTQTSDPTKGPISAERFSVDDAQAGPISGEKKEPGATTTEEKGDEISQG